MAKKKNREKAFRKQHKLDIKLLSNEEADIFELLERKPVFVERRMFMDFDERQVAMMQFCEETGDYPDANWLNRVLVDETFKFSEDHALFKQAMSTQNDSKRTKLLKKVLSVNPDYLLAELHLLMAGSRFHDEESCRKVLAFYNRILATWHQKGYSSWVEWEARPYLESLMFCLDYFYEEGLYGLVRDIIDLINRKHPLHYPPNFIFTMLSFYNEVGDYDKVEKFYKRQLETYQIQDGVLLHLIISKILRGKLEEAKVLFKELYQINDSVVTFFAQTEWFWQIEMVEGLDCFVPFSEEAIASALSPLAFTCMDNVILASSLTQMARELATELGLGTPRSPKDVLRCLHSPLFAGLRFDIIRILTQNGLYDLTDFSQKTEKDVLALKGIGAKTVEQLKKNGVIFKQDT